MIDCRFVLRQSLRKEAATTMASEGLFSFMGFGRFGWCGNISLRVVFFGVVFVYSSVLRGKVKTFNGLGILVSDPFIVLKRIQSVMS